MTQTAEILNMTVQLTSAYVSRNNLPAAELPALIQQIHQQLHRLQDAQSAPVANASPPQPAVSPQDSVHQDYIVCLEDGKKFKSLKRHLRTAYRMTPEEYRTKWGLPSDYPMVSPAYAKLRSDMARKMGLGRKQEGSQ